MTTFLCHCGKAHDSAVQGPCPQTFTVVMPPLSPDETGREIRRLLMSLHAPGHTLDDERRGSLNYATDELRQQALDRAGICWLTPGEMAPACCCEWSPDKPEGPRLRMQENVEERRKLWADECITRGHASGVCSRGTKSCVVKHRGGVG